MQNKDDPDSNFNYDFVKPDVLLLSANISQQQQNLKKDNDEQYDILQQIKFENCFYGKYQMVPEGQRKEICDLLSKDEIRFDKGSDNQRQTDEQLQKFNEKIEECRGCDRKPIVERTLNNLKHLYDFFKD